MKCIYFLVICNYYISYLLFFLYIAMKHNTTQKYQVIILTQNKLFIACT